MCHHFEAVDELSAQDREEILTEHSPEELQAEYAEDELEKLGVSI